MICLKDFSFRYETGASPALKEIGLTIHEGDFIGIIGNSGAGKTTLTYALAGVIPHYYPGDFYGSIEVDDLDTVETRPEDIASKVGLVFQDVDAQMVASVVEDELLFGLENFGVPHDQIEGRLSEALAQTGISDLRYREIDGLSGGQKQKVAVAAMIALRPKYLVLDEPTGELDPQSSEQVFNLLKYLNEQFGTTVIVVEQKIGLLCQYVKRMILLEQGQILLDGPVRDVLKKADQMEETGIHVPRVVSLYKELYGRDLYQGEAPIDVKEAYSMCREVLS